jgi:hypothetical protein
MSEGNTELIPVKVESYSGYKADEYPRCFYWNNIRYEIDDILDRWYQGAQNPEWPVSDYFRVKTVDGKIFLLKHEISADVWYLCRRIQ